MKRWLRRGLVFTAVSAFCALFGGIYEVYSHGVYSYSMIYAFAIPLVMGAIPSLVMAMLSRPCKVSVSFDLYIFAIATATVESILKGVLEIYGTSSRLMVLFVIFETALLLSAVIFAVADRLKNRRKRENAE